MPNRTTPELVEGIIEVDVDNIPLDPFIATANALVTEICVPEGYDDDRLELIERYLSAHFYTLRDPRNVTETAGSVQETHQSKVDLFLCTSHHGQTAMLLDTKGGLANLDRIMQKGGRRALSVTWLGLYPPCPPVPQPSPSTMPVLEPRE